MPKYSVIEKYKRKIKEYNKISQIGGMARRYFVMNVFDGVLTILGIILASFFAGLKDSRIIVIACLGAAIANSISGLYGAYLAEKAEKTSKLKKIEKATYLNLKKSHISRAYNFAALELGLVDGLSTLIAAVIIISPFLFNLSITISYYISFLLSFMILFLTGMFLGKVSKENLFLSGAKLILVGVICTIIILLVERLG